MFILDVNSAFQPWLVERKRLFAAVNTLDGDKKRGLLLIELTGGRPQVLGVYASLFRKLFGLMKFTFGLEPKFHIPPQRFAIFFPDFTGALSDAFLVGPCQCHCPSSAFFRHCPYPSGRFPVADPSREVAVFFGPWRAGG